MCTSLITLFSTFMHSAEEASNKTILIPPLCNELLKHIPSMLFILQYSQINCVGTYSNSESYRLNGFDKSLLIICIIFCFAIISGRENVELLYA